MRFVVLLVLGGLLLVGPLAPAASAQTPAPLGPADSALAAARVHFAAEDYAAAVGVLEAVAPGALSSDARFLLGRSYQALLQHAEAAAVLARGDTTNARVLAALGRSYDQLGRTPDAFRAFRAAYALEPDNPAYGAALARFYAEKRQWAQVQAIYQHLLALDEDNPLFHAQLAAAFRADEQPDSAIVHFEIARRLNPRSLGVILGLTSVYFNADMLISARRVIDKAIEDLPEESLVWQRCGDIAIQEEDSARGVECYFRALALGDSTGLNLRNLGVAYYLEGDLDDAAEALQASYRADSTDGMATFYLGMAYQGLGRHDDALTYLGKTADLMGREILSDVYGQIANTRDQMEQDGEAIRQYRIARSLAPEKPEWLFRLAALYDSYYADKDTALETYEAFLAAVDSAQLGQLQEIARRRVSELREDAFFRNGLEDGGPPESSRPDTVGGER